MPVFTTSRDKSAIAIGIDAISLIRSKIPSLPDASVVFLHSNSEANNTRIVIKLENFMLTICLDTEESIITIQSVFQYKTRFIFQNLYCSIAINEITKTK